MPYSQELAARIRTAIGKKKGIEERRMFGGVGFLLNGHMLVGVWKDSLIVRLDEEEGEGALRERHVRVFDITGKAMKGWIMVAAEGTETDDEVKGWVKRAVKYVGKLEPKTGE
jgi:TfoX/Sxy family transcriptional regulator of competence genes